MHPTPIELAATILFALAVLHTFCVKRFAHIAENLKSGSVGENVFHLLAEVEVVFAFWAGLLLVAMLWLLGAKETVIYIETLDFTEPAFVFVVMAIAATRPVIEAANGLIAVMGRLLPLPGESAFLFTALVVGPLLGSLITEPAAMTVTALILKDRLFDNPAIERRVKYLALGVLFVNVSIGGVLTPYAAPPVLMVAKTWNWDVHFMMTHFGYKAVVAVIANAALLVALGGKALAKAKKTTPLRVKVGPAWLSLVHMAVLAGVVLSAHHLPVFFGIFLFFLGVADVTREYQSPLKLKESLLVAAFLGGLVVLGRPQEWWLEPLLTSFSDLSLYLGATALTAVTDNAALTYLGSQVQTVSDSMKYALVAGAVVGGGLTVIANAPNPAGYSVLQRSFGKEGVSPLGLLLGALIPTAVAMTAFWFLPHISN